MTRWTLCPLFLSMLIFVGCRGGDYVDHSQDPEAFAQSVKEMVVVAVEDARESDEPADAMFSLVHELEEEELRYRPTGDYLNIYQEIHSLGSEIEAAAEAANGRPADLDQRLDELLALAEQLPGEVVEYEVDDDEDGLD